MKHRKNIQNHRKGPAKLNKCWTKISMFPLKKKANIGAWIASRGIELPKESAWWSINRFVHAMNFGLPLCTFFHSHLFALAAYFMHIILLRKLSSLRLAFSVPIVIVAGGGRNAAGAEPESPTDACSDWINFWTFFRPLWPEMPKT